MAIPSETLPTLTDTDIAAIISSGRKAFPADPNDGTRISRTDIPLEERSALCAYVLRYMSKEKAAGLDIQVTTNYEENPLDDTVQHFLESIPVASQRVIGVAITFKNRINAGRVSDFARDLTNIARLWGAENLGMPKYDEFNDPARQETNKADKSFTFQLALGFNNSNLPFAGEAPTPIPASLPVSQDVQV